MNKANHQRSEELQEVKRRLKLKDQALEAVKGELERVKQTKTTEKVIEIVHLYCIFKTKKPQLDLVSNWGYLLNT